MLVPVRNIIPTTMVVVVVVPVGTHTSSRWWWWWWWSPVGSVSLMGLQHITARIGV